MWNILINILIDVGLEWKKYITRIPNKTDESFLLVKPSS